MESKLLRKQRLEEARAELIRLKNPPTPESTPPKVEVTDEGADSHSKLVALDFRAAESVLLSLRRQTLMKRAKQDITILERYYPGAEWKLKEWQEESVEGYYSNTKLRPKDTVALMITFNPDPKHDMSPHKLLELGEKVIKLTSGVKESYLAIEQSGTIEGENLGINSHFHAILILDKTSQSGEIKRVGRRVINILEPYKTKTTRFLDIKLVSQDRLQDKILYLNGDKDEHKLPACDGDVVWREENKIPQIIHLTRSDPLG